MKRKRNQEKPWLSGSSMRPMKVYPVGWDGLVIHIKDRTSDHLNGYVQVQKGHPYHGLSASRIDRMIGPGMRSISYSKDDDIAPGWWIGFTQAEDYRTESELDLAQLIEDIGRLKERLDQVEARG